MLELLLKEIRNNQAKMDTDSKAWREEMAAERRAIKARTEAIKARTATMQEKRLKANINAWQEETTACQDAMETNPRDKVDVVDRHKIPNEEEETRACQEMEAHLEEEEPTSVDMKPEAAEQREVPIRDATVMPVREPEEEMTPVTRKEMMACRQTTEVHLEEKQLTSLDRKPEAAEQ
jgi:hypothetical protein